MMMKSKKSNKKLALLVGMALSAGFVFGFVPSANVYAATVEANASSVNSAVTSYDITKNGSSFTVKSNGEVVNIGNNIGTWFNEKAAAGDVTFNFSSWNDFFPFLPTENGEILSSGNNVTFQIGNESEGGGVLVLNSGVNYVVPQDGDGHGVFTGNLSSVTIYTKNDVPSTLTFGDDAKVDNLNFVGAGADAASGPLTITGAPTVNNMTVTGNATLGDNSNVKVNNMTVAEGATFDVSSGTAEVGNLTLAGKLTGGQSNSLTAGTVNITSTAQLDSDTTIKTNKLVLDSNVTSEQIDALNVATKEGNGTVDVAFNGVPNKEVVNALKAKANTEGSNIDGNAVTAAVENAANQAVEGVAAADPFASKLPTADEIADMSTLSDAQKAKVIEAVQQAGKTAAAPAVTSSRAATAITTVLTNNVVTRTAEIRGFASAVDEGRPAPDKMWFQYKHTNMDVDGGDTYSKSTINTNNFQLGYDTQIGTNDYLGAYIGTTTGNADFNGPARNGRIDIDNSFDFGVYGTHMLPNDQYIDYMVHTGKFDSEFDSSKWGTKDTGAMVGYGAKIAQTDSLTLNPYIQLAYDKISVDSYTTRSGNVIKSDDSNNWTAKLGLNLIDASGLYGGVAYSRGLSGSYNAYINGVAMPTSDYNANVLYLSLGYRASMARNAVLDLSMEKTFMDYKGWTAAGKVNFYF